LIRRGYSSITKRLKYLIDRVSLCYMVLPQRRTKHDYREARLMIDVYQENAMLFLAKKTREMKR
jgi:hypothetical protein